MPEYATYSNPGKGLVTMWFTKYENRTEIMLTFEPYGLPAGFTHMPETLIYAGDADADIKQLAHEQLTELCEQIDGREDYWTLHDYTEEALDSFAEALTRIVEDDSI